MGEYGDFLTDKIKEILQANLPESKIVTWWDGDPLQIPQSALPAIAIETDRVDIGPAATGMLNYVETVRVKVMVNKKDDFGKAPEQVIGHRTLKEITIGRDKDDSKELHSQSIVYLLDKNFTLSNNVYNQEVSVEFGVVPRANAETEEGELMLTAEAHVIVALSDLIEMPNRS